jgi:acyl-CoA reductase-like NAD-dependent aldehyde dehydrogenase
MVHKAQTASNIQEAAEKAGLKITRRGGRKSGDDYSDNAEVIEPIMIEGVTPKGPMLTCDWDGKGERTFNPATTEFFMPILTVMEVETFDDFIKFCLFENTHDLSTALWTKNPAVLARARGTLGGMLKINDGTDAALDWEEFGASGMGDSGNMGVGDAESTVKIFTRKQKGRQLQL